MVGVNPWVAHANRSVFGEDADMYRPERWLEEDGTDGENKMEQYFFTVSSFQPSNLLISSYNVHTSLASLLVSSIYLSTKHIYKSYRIPSHPSPSSFPSTQRA